MVNGLDLFTEYFREHNDSYVIIGGTACDMIMEEAGLRFRATKDIDMILIVEGLSKEFVTKFWEFIRAGDYGKREQSQQERKHYRFNKPANSNFPHQIELFARRPDIVALDEKNHLTPIPTEEDLSGLSAILMNEVFYKYVLANSIVQNNLHRAKMHAVICLKSKAFLEMTERKSKGDEVSDKEIKKHRNDVFKLALLLTGEEAFDLPAEIKRDMVAFADAVRSDLPNKAIYEEIGLQASSEQLLELLVRSFRI